MKRRGFPPPPSPKQKKKCRPWFPIRIFFFLSHSFGIKMTNTLTHSRNSLENHTRFPTILYGQSLYMFSDRNAAKTIPFGVACAYYWISLYTPPQAKKPLVIARLLKPSPQKETTTTANLLLVTTTYCFVTWVYKTGLTYMYANFVRSVE